MYKRCMTLGLLTLFVGSSAKLHAEEQRIVVSPQDIIHIRTACAFLQVLTYLNFDHSWQVHASRIQEKKQGSCAFIQKDLGKAAKKIYLYVMMEGN